jgi:hypothetical protein
VAARSRAWVSVAWILGSWVWIPLKAWMFVLIFLCCVVLCRQRPCVELITRPRSPTKCRKTQFRNLTCVMLPRFFKDCRATGKRKEVIQRTFQTMAVFWVVAPCSLVEIYQRFRGPCCFHHQGDRPDDGGSKDFWNVGKSLPDYTVLQPRRQPSSYSPPWKPQILPVRKTVSKPHLKRWSKFSKNWKETREERKDNIIVPVLN